MLFACHFPDIPDASFSTDGTWVPLDRGRQGWNKTAERIASKYDRLGLGALVGSDRAKGHISAAGLAAACRGNYA